MPDVVYWKKRTAQVAIHPKSHSKQYHVLSVGPRLVRIIENDPSFIPGYCHHCAKAPCIEACTVGAISRNDQGIILIDSSLCIGCRACVEACLFEAMQFDEEVEIAVKWDLCIERLAQNKKPACVSICPTRCISFKIQKSIATQFQSAL